MAEAFFTLHADIPREGPGDRASLDWALGLAALPPEGRVLDAGCGPGADVDGLLAHVPEGEVVAVDLHAGFVERVAARFAEDARVTAKVADMRNAGFGFDLIWAAGSLYFLGITEGLKLWRDALAVHGKVAFSELVWLGAPEASLRHAFESEYPAMGDLDALLARIEAADYELLGLQVMSEESWEEYYGPMQARIDRLRPGAEPELAAVLDEAQVEIDLWREHHGVYGYAMAVVAPR